MRPLGRLFKNLGNTHEAPGDETFAETGPCECSPEWPALETTANSHTMRAPPPSHYSIMTNPEIGTLVARCTGCRARYPAPWAVDGNEPMPYDFARDAAELTDRERPHGPVEAEHTISTASGNSWPALPGIDYATLFQPRSLVCGSAEAEGDHSFRTGTALISVSWELASTWAVYVEGAASLEAADLIVEEMARQLGEATGETALHYRING
ncbi:hypothetical protein [Streptomyces sp. NK15101]|uniref:hypothetical protein n=1 Tax=Streptomyces sp. NK15101 TaxID=2873261 RepID=UPI001CED3F78|nr:hypothetical protein [Streptomyces sp. NK15101]